ncbi:MAG: hypothetical protein CMJ89_15380 [Planctomycetes bacterium]|nr:hypothetical protein [Planctomycetota bacterium]
MHQRPVSAGIIAENPLSGLRSLPVGKRHTIRKRDFSREELAAFLREAKAVDQESGDKVGQYPVWLALAATGARWGETVALRWADVDTSRNELFFRGEAAKSGRDRRVPIPKTLLDELLALRRMHHDLLGRLPAGSDLVFLNPGAMPWTQRNRNDAQKRFRELLCRAAIERENERGRLTPHSLRHTFATHCAIYGVPMAHCQQMLGHSTIALTAEIYTHVRTEALHLAVSRLPDPTQSDSRLGTRWALEGASSDSASEAAS